MKKRKLRILGISLLTIIFIILFISFFYWPQPIGAPLMLLSVVLTTWLLNIGQTFGKIEGSGHPKEDFEFGEEYEFISFKEAPADWRERHLFFVKKDGKEVYCSGYFYFFTPEQGDLLIIGKCPGKNGPEGPMFLMKKFV